jgi:hypothetical protein
MATTPDEMVRTVSKAREFVVQTANKATVNFSRIAVSAAVFLAIFSGAPAAAPAVTLLVFVAWGKK